MSRYVGIMYKIDHSFIQSRINYCSLLWGFTNKSNIDVLFTKQKKGIKAVIPGFIIYGETAGHAKSDFTNYKILNINGIIRKVLCMELLMKHETCKT